MSILIKGMEMPNTYPLTVIIYQDGTVVDVYGGGKARAITLPPHGRLKDADAYEALIRGLGDREY